MRRNKFKRRGANAEEGLQTRLRPVHTSDALPFAGDVRGLNPFHVPSKLRGFGDGSAGLCRQACLDFPVSLISSSRPPAA